MQGKEETVRSWPRQDAAQTLVEQGLFPRSGARQAGWDAPEPGGVRLQPPRYRG